MRRVGVLAGSSDQVSLVISIPSGTLGAGSGRNLAIYRIDDLLLGQYFSRSLSRLH